MENDPELNGKFLGQITQDFVKVAELLKEACYQVRVRKFSEYPIVLICKREVAVGQLLIQGADFGLQWNFYLSFLKEFTDRELVIEPEKFKAAYRDPDEYCCLFVVEPDFTNFIYIPYPED